MTTRARDLLEVLTIGLPFCAFKLLTGLVLIAGGWTVPLGWALIALGAADLVVNAVNALALAAGRGRGRVLGACIAQIAAHRLRGSWDELGNSIDVMLSFALVAVMIGFHLLGALPAVGLQIWNVAVILNVLGAGFGRMSSTLSTLSSRPR